MLNQSVAMREEKSKSHDLDWEEVDLMNSRIKFAQMLLPWMSPYLSFVGVSQHAKISLYVFVNLITSFCSFTN